MLRLSVASAVLACAATWVFVPGALAQGKGRDDSRTARGVPEHGNADDGKTKGKSEQPARGARDKGAPGKTALPNPQVSKAIGGRGLMRETGAAGNSRTAPGARDLKRNLRGGQQVRAFVPPCPPGLAEKYQGCLPPGVERKTRNKTFGYAYRPALFGVPARGRGEYAYYDGFLVPIGGTRESYVPLLGGALAVGQIWPSTYPSFNLPDWQRDYFGFDDPRDYHYADNVVYRIDPETAAIRSVTALLTGSEFKIGSPLPSGYDVYNVPAAYRSRYADGDDALYRYADGRVYRIDPATNLVVRAIDLVL